jgi:soluble lytic murein transglycosylase
MAAAAWADDKADFLAARDALARGDLNAVAAGAEALAADPLGIYPRYWLLSQQMDRLGPDQILPFLNYYQGSWLAEKLRGEWLRSLARRGDWARFREQYPLLLDEPGTELRCDDFSARLAGKDNAVLAEARTALWFTAQDLPAACDPVLERLTASGTVTKADIWARLRLALAANAQGLARHLADLLGSSLSARELQHLEARPAVWLRRPTHGGRLRQELALYALGRLARSDPDAAYRDLRGWLPRLATEQRLYAWRQLGLVAARQHDARAAEWLDKSEGLPWSDADLEWRARVALLAQDWDGLLAVLDRLSDARRQERSWQYWRARALEATGKAQDARRLYASLSLEDDYYGLLARDRLGPVVGPGRTVYKVSDEDARQVRRNAGLQRALALNDMGLRPEAVREWNWALRGADDRLLLAAAEAANRAGWYDRAIYAAERTKNLHNFELRYLAPFREVTRGYAQDLGLDEAWVYGLIRQESRFVSVARSGVGAGGLMQLMPRTAQWVANRLHIPYHAGMVNDAGTNVQLGTYYLRHVLEELDNQPVLATAAYNAGPSRARQWQDADKPMEAAVYIETIPFGETRDYVKKVMTNAVYYAMAFGQGRQSLEARLGTVPPRSTQALQGP